MKIRFPTVADVLGLFVSHTTVDGALAELRKAGERAAAVIAHNRAQSAAAEQRRKDLVDAAATEAGLRDTHAAEADRAERVSSKLNELLA